MPGRIVKDKNKPKTWYVWVEAGRDPSNNRRKRIKRTVHSSREADLLFAQLQMEIEKGTYIDPSYMTVAEYLHWWLDAYCKVKLKPSTIDSYKGICENHLIPDLGALKLDKLHQMHLQQYIAKALESGRILQKKKSKKNSEEDRRNTGLSLRTVQYHHRVLSKALTYAVKNKIINHNIAQDVQAPSPKRPEIKSLDAEQSQHLLKIAAEHHDYLVIYTALGTAMRLGEVLGLKWQDVNLKNNMIMVQRNLQYSKARGFYWGSPKGGRGRSIPLTKELGQLLKDRRKSQLANLKHKEKGDKLVFTDTDGQPLKPVDTSKRFTNLAKKAGFEGFTFHGLRHTWATLALASGVHPKVVQMILGHSSIAITLDIYSHVLPAMYQEAVSVVSNLFLIKKDGAQMVPNNTK
jgi:integrase